MATAGAGGRVAIPTEFLSPLGNPQRFSFVEAIPVSFAKATFDLLTFDAVCGIILCKMQNATVRLILL
jgi:hypothetical protein